MLCSSCGHDNPRENRYCGMCGTPFPHRPLTVPDAQSTLTFNSAPLEIAPSHLSVAGGEPAHPAPSSASAVVQNVEPPPAPVVSEPPVAEEVEPVFAAETVAPAPFPAETPVEAAISVAEDVIPASQPEEIPVEAGFAEAIALTAEPAVTPEESRTPVAVDTEPLIATPPVGGVPEAPPPISPAPPEIREFARHTPRIEPPARVDADSGKPFVIRRPPPPQSTEPPPDSAGMPTFQAVTEAAGAPAISPFEPPVEKHPDEERELQEFVAQFRYNPPQEAVDELTMRSEVPVLDAEAPATPSHPSFDDDVPPPPEAGPHPTGEEYYPPRGASSDHSRFLEVGSAASAEAAQPKPPSARPSFLGVDDASPAASTVLAEAGSPPPRRHRLLWWSVAALVVIFGGLGYLEGRAQMTHAFRGPIEVIQSQYASLRQRLSELTARAPAAPAETRVTETPATSESPAKSAATDASSEQTKASDNASAASSPAGEPAVTADQQQSKADNQVATTEQKGPADTQPKPESVASATKPPAAKVALTEPPTASKPGSKAQPGQQELAKAMQASDPAAAAIWLWKSTSRGNPEAPVRLADMYIRGKGVARSCEQALVLLRAQAAKEDAPARNRLAALYANGTCVARDRVRAYQLMGSALAVDPTSEWAEQNRKELWEQMTPEERTQAEKYR